jgi:hypothetical protein
MSQEAIVAVVNLYSVALDSHSWDLFDEIFTQDVESDYPGEHLHWYDLASFKRDFARMHESTAGHQHLLGYPQVVIDGDRAFSLTYGRFNVFRTSPAVKVQDMSEGGAWYDDELIRTPAGWRIRHRVARNFWRIGSLPGEGDAPLVVESFPEWARSGRVGYVNALRKQAKLNAAAR